MTIPGWDWQDSAACRQMGLELFFGPDGERQPERDRREEIAKDVCAACPVISDCRGWAVGPVPGGTGAGLRIRGGIWGGLNEDELRDERRRRTRRAEDGRKAERRRAASEETAA